MLIITIVTIVKNGEESIARTIRSVLLQKNDHVEYVIIDGGSTDKTVEIINSFKNEVDHVLSESDKGISDAFNKGIMLSKGKYIWLLNAGDVLLDKALDEALVAARSNPDADIIYGDVLIKKKCGQSTLRHSDHKNLKRRMSIAHPATLANRNLFFELGRFREDFRIAMDYDFLLRADKLKKKFVKIEMALSVMESGGVSDTKWVRSLYESHMARSSSGVSPFLSFIFFITDVFYSSVFRSVGALRRLVN